MKRRDFIRGGLYLSAALGGGHHGAGAMPAVDSSFDPAAWGGDLAMVNGKIITLDPARPQAEAALVRMGRIVAVGSNAEIRERAAGAKVFDAEGRGIVPGFVDTHMHLEMTAAAWVLMVDLHQPVPKSIAEVLARVKKRIDVTPAGKWVIAEGYVVRNVAEKRLPTIDELDAISQRHPIVVFNSTHENSANTLATKMMGYLTPEEFARAKWRSDGSPFAGGHIERDAQGLPTIAFDAKGLLPPDIYTADEMRDSLHKITEETFVAGGVTSVSTMSTSTTRWHPIEQQMQAEGELPLRIRAYYVVPHAASLDAVLQAGLSRGFGNDMFRIGGFKLFLDAHHPTLPTIHHYNVAELTNLIMTMDAAGFQSMTHCTSIEGAGMVIEAVEEVRRRRPQSPVIHRIEHHRARPEFAARMKAARMSFSLIAPQVPTRAANFPGGSGMSSAVTLPYRSYIANGVHPILISDQCNGMHTMPRPLFSIAAACNDYDHKGMTEAGETIGFDDALRMWTLWAAESSHQAHDRGSITPGKLGDFAVLSADPGSLHPNDYFSLKVSATILGGRVIYEA